MGQRPPARADIGAIRAVAGRFEDVADLIDDAVRVQLGRLAFDGATAGGTHIAHGDALRRSLQRIESELVAWSRAAGEIAVTLRASADRYGEAEAGAAARVG